MTEMVGECPVLALWTQVPVENHIIPRVQHNGHHFTAVKVARVVVYIPIKFFGNSSE